MRTGKYFLSFIFCGLCISLQGQGLLDQLGKSLTKEIGKKGGEKKESLDSVDYQFAVSVTENAGFFDMKDKGEGESKFLYAFKEQADKSPVEIARDTLELGLGYYELRLFRFAEESFRGTEEYLKQNSLTDHLVYLRAISNIGLLCLTQGKNADADVYLNNALQMSEQKLGKNSPAYIANLNNVGKLHQALGKYNEAEKEFQDALTLGEKYYGEGMEKAILLNNKAMLLQAVGRYNEALELMQKAVSTSMAASTKKEKAKKKTLDNRRFQFNLGYIHQLSGDYPKAEATFLEAKKIFENRAQTKAPEYAGLLNQLGILYTQMGQNDKVEPLLKKSREIYKGRFTEQNVFYAKVTDDLGNFYRMNSRYEEAEKQLNKALEIRESLLGTNHPDYVRTQENLAILYWKTNRYEQAYMTYREVMDKTIEFINAYFPPMSEAEKTNFWDVTAPRFQRFFNFSLEVGSQLKYVSQDFFDYHMATKALLLNSTNKVKEAILKSNDRALINDYLLWLDQKEQLARLYAYSKEQLKEQKIDLAAMERSTNAMEKSLSQRSADFSAGYSTQKLSYKQVLALLGDTEALVDIVRVRGFGQDFTNDSRYVALILKKGLEMPQLVVLENGQHLETRYSKYYRNAIHNKLTDEHSYDQYWAKIENEIQGKKIIYVSPDGAYNSLNLNTLKKPNADYVVNRYDLVIIGNSKDLIGLKSKKASVPKKNAFMLGFPDYGTAEVSALPGTKVEIDGVAKILKTAGYQVSQFMQKDASEKNIKSIKGPSLVHIATHGYFLQDADESAGSVFGVNAENASNNPLLRSGLILAGAGKTITGSGGVDITSNDNGVLTAYEAMNLNLEGTSLVILSACETGLGDVKSGEGVYGLQRAFQVAGADALIMSLWKVDDAATQLLMTNFYTNWIKLGNKQKAFKQAQLQLMTKYKEPYYWGAFVMMGM
jgi:CHAT domain-containing protein